ncbi:Tn3 family transposase [Rhizobium ruizarguesonis]|uniref:Tn3 family transposase n=1 Tax=Rhizobium ruizarguesonis TaxID=2081791 RepID=UPI0010302504|nr:Tn3 family transposase [Rhizobium ruizarguesonis]TAV02069.1 Tn3 family transposase [Rhizobium ruizarguesonis]TAV19588.1 Tn3 family transposase [Rhizobium ruizarguesonis]
MPRRMILTDAERQNFLALPTDDDTLIRHWSLDDDDRRLIETRRHDDTRLGLALQLCALRYPGRLIQRGEVIPSVALSFLAEQLGIDPEALSTFARRAATRYEQLAILRQHYGFTELSHPLRADLLAFARGIAIAATKDKFVVATLADEMRRRRIVIPGITVLERLAGQACTEAEEALYADVAGRLAPDLIIRMEALLGAGRRAKQSGISWLREPPGKAGVSAMRGLIDRLEAVRHAGIPNDVLQAIPAHRVRRMAQEGRRLTAQNFEQMRPGRRHATLAAFLLEMEIALTDAAIGMFETLIGKSFRQAEATRDKQLLESASSATSALDFFANFGEAITAQRESGLSLDEAVTTVTSWEELIQATASAKAVKRPRSEDDLITYLSAQYVRIRRFVTPFLASFTFEGNRRNAHFIEAIVRMETAWRKGSRSAEQPWVRKALLLANARWRKKIVGADGAIDRKMLELFLIVELKNRIAAGDIWIRGSRAYRALDEHMISQQTFAVIKAEARIPVAIPIDVETYLTQKAEALDQKLREAARRLEAGRGDTRIGAKGLRVPAVRTTETEAATAFARRVATTMPPVRLTDLVADIDRMTGFSSLFEHLQTGRPPSNLRVFYAALIAEATNLGFSKMAHACPGITRRQLQQMAIWHFREETFTLALAKLVEAQHSTPFSTMFGSNTVSSSDGQHIHLGDGGEVAGSVNGRYGNNPIIKLYTAISGRYAPFHTKIIAATASEAVHVLDALLETDAGLHIIRHHVDGGGVSDLVFALCHALGFAFVPRIPDLDGRCLYGFEPAKQYGILQNVMGDRIDADLIRANWDDILRLMTSLRTRTVSASLMLKRLSATTRQSGLAQALRQMGRIERTIFTLDWINDEQLRKTTTAELNKGESRNSLVRAVNLHRLGRFRDRSQENLSIRASALNLIVSAIIHWNTIYTGRIVDALRNAGQAIPDHLLSSLSPLTWEHVNLTGDYLWEEKPALDENGFRAIPFVL